ncbi:MAG: molecular chaperone HtpG [Gammaproteobacteria bacterium]|nr:molecular chaperone HtpG [Gammaproteobacteria bacterium]
MSATPNKETLSFQAEVKQLLHLMVHSLYSNKEIFLRELISNAADAADKLRFKALADDKLWETEPNLKIRITADKAARTLTIADNGTGMTRDECAQNLGTIARSGTAEFFQQLSGDQQKDAKLIGQFGVGFYSAFIVADKVTVRTRAAGHEASQAVIWESAGDGSYTLETTEKAGRGTEITLHLREGEDEFLDDWRLRSVITKYSDHISLPVEMVKPFHGEEKDKPETPEYEAVNRATALWLRDKKELKDEEYTEFYKHIAHDFEDPLTWTHNKVEGNHEYTSLLYIPGRAPYDLWNREKAHGLKLYVQRVFIMDDAEVFLPTYLRFVRGLIDSNDLPLNVSREILQESKTSRALREATAKRVLSMLDKLAQDDGEKYQNFWNEFGNVLKEGPAEDFGNREAVAKLLRFSSTHTDAEKQDVSIQDYIGRMKPEQKAIYYITAESFATAKNSPHLEIFRKKGVEVLLMAERIDEWLMSHLEEFEGKKFVSVTRGKLDLGELADEEEKKAEEAAQTEYKSLIERVKTALGDKAKDVRVTSRLTSSPACIVADDKDMNLQLQRLLKQAGQAMPEPKPIFELNPEHALVKRLHDEADETRFEDLVAVLFDQALLAESGQLNDPAAFAARLNKLLLELVR